jgi:hypothetical protein
MAQSGDALEKAAASTEILLNGQERLKAALDGTHESIMTGAKSYEDYRSSIEATAAAAGYQIDAQGNLIQVIYGLGGATIKLIDANYALGASEYELQNTGRTRGQIATDLIGQLLTLGQQAEAYNATLQASAGAEGAQVDVQKQHTAIMREYSNELL